MIEMLKRKQEKGNPNYVIFDHGIDNPFTLEVCEHDIIIIIIIMSLFKEDNIFSASTNLTYGTHKTWLNTYYLQTVKIYIYKIVQDTLKFDFKIFSD